MIPRIRDYPKEIRLNGDVYTVKFVKMKDAGLTDPNKFEILICKGMTRKETFKTFIHELLHVMEFTEDLPIPHKLVYKIEEAMFDLWEQNFT